MFLRIISIISSSFKMAMQELWKNKLRTFLSLFGITIGIFCIIGVMATVGSLEKNIQNEIRSLGNNTIYIDKWDYTAGGTSDYPFWKFAARPSPKYAMMKQIKERTPGAQYVAFRIGAKEKVESNNNILTNINHYGISEDFNKIQPVELISGRYISDAEFSRGSPSAVIGFDVAEKLFGSPEAAVGQTIRTRGKKMLVTGVIKKQGQQMIGGWNFDQSIILPYFFARTILSERRADPFILVQGKEGITGSALKDELKGSMRAINKLPPASEDNFALNDINDFSTAITSAFKNLKLGGWAIAGLSLIVGMFGVANIMFVTVRERTSQIGLKKAIGANNSLIQSEFLLESAFLCIIGGMIGILLVFILTKILSNVLDFPVFISTANMGLALLICILVGIIAGFIPAKQASALDPVTAIRSK